MERVLLPNEKRENFNPHQQRAVDALENYSGELISCELRVTDLQDVNFMKSLTQIDLPVEISVVEGLNGMAKLTTGFDGESLPMEGSKKVAQAGDEIITNRHMSGRFSIHTHLTGTEYDLAPSPGDMNVNRLRSFKVSTPAIIMNEYGYSIVGVNPYAKWFAEEIKKKHTFGNDERIDHLVERGDWLYNIPADYEDFFVKMEQMDIHEDIKIMFAFELAKKLGLLLAHRPWEEVTEIPKIAFDPQAADEYWRLETETLLREVESGEKNLDDLWSGDLVQETIEEMFEYVRNQNQ